MKISYQRGMQKNFMIIDPEELDWEGYECRMLLRNNIEGLLKMKIRPMAEGPRFYYDITSRQPLSRMLKGAQWDAREFRSFMIYLCDTLGRLQNYLLKESRILLDPDLIYMEPESRRLSLCYVPGLVRPFSEDLADLLEGLLECVDHTDRECVVLAYGLCQETRKENYGMDDLLRQVYSAAARDEAKTAPEKSIPKVPVFTEERTPEKEEKKGGFLEKLKDRVFSHLPREEDEQENDDELWFENFDVSEPERRVPFKDPSGVHTAKNPLRENRGKENAEGKNTAAEIMVRGNPVKENMVRETAVRYESTGREEERLRSGETVILTGLDPDLGIHILRALDPGMSDIPITYYPFIIGKQENLVDYRLDDDTVSRLHLKIEKRDEKYLIEDLNSTNGTSLNGVLLENNGEREIAAGDEIDIARFRFRFE